MYPIVFENLYYDRIWGGRELEAFRDNLPEGNIGESWDIACHPNGMGVVKNGEFKGLTFEELIKQRGAEILGSEIKGDRFPLLIKIITANDKLSVQVHPGDEYALKNEGDLGKTEAWYVIDAKEGASLVVGTKDCTKEEFEKALNSGDLEKYLNRVYVKPGDFYFVKSGLVHAIEEGVTIAEIQQNSDTTYRVYDYNRGREIHVQKALDVIDFSLSGKNAKGIKIQEDGYLKEYLSLCPYFSIEKYVLQTEVTESSDKERFYIFTCTEGSGEIKYTDGTVKYSKGDSVFIPATLGEYKIIGKSTLLKSYVPNEAKVEEEILNNIRG
ncbi:mannose-6-phosphate isomerase, class I [Clostridium paridis]|uniref:mannose-6-phosphate isomerase n=1 Tax=Clostridium paridis TaxID=2803863 RepID=A0A937K372_9CLOT|nr:mannose-6-phosphate isomerase, class I [Clostridium paridis]MBL4932111.1 mannose-6-phosphate isomerase, class I [Clostridium paridis]